MEIDEALRLAAERAKWSPEQIAVTAGASFSAVKKWLRAETTPGGKSLMALRRGLPGFAELLDGERVA
jgi:transcriptional regulator with XRE-family HTH domain